MLYLFSVASFIKIIISGTETTLYNWKSKMFLVLSLDFQKETVHITGPLSGRCVFIRHRLWSVSPKSLTFITALGMIKYFISSSKQVRLLPYPNKGECSSQLSVSGFTLRQKIVFCNICYKAKIGSDVNVDKRVSFKQNLRCSLGHGSQYSRKTNINSGILNFNRQSSETIRSRRH